MTSLIRHIRNSILCLTTLTICTSSVVDAQSLTELSQRNMSKSRRWTVLNGGGWASVAGGQLSFHSATGERLRKLNLRGNEYLFASPGSEAVGVIAFADRQPKTLSAVTFDLFDERGKQIVRVDKPKFASAIVSPTGNAFVGIDGASGLPTSVLRFYDRTGRSHDTPTIERYKAGEFSRDGSTVFIESVKSGLTAYAPTGRVLNSYGAVDRWAASKDGSVVIIQRGEQLLLYHNGESKQALSWRASSEPVRDLALSPNGLQAAITSASRAAIIDMATARTLWESDAGDPEWNFRSIDLLDDAALVVVGLDYDPGPRSEARHTRSRALVFDRSGKLVDTKNDASKKWGSDYPNLRFDRDQELLFFLNQDRYQVFRVNDAAE